MNNVCVTSCYELEMLDEHTASLFNLLICNRTTPKPPTPPTPPPPPTPPTPPTPQIPQINPNNKRILSFHIL